MASYDSVADIVRAMYVNTFGAEQQQQQQQAVDGWSLAGHIQRVLANDAEYMPYFLALLGYTFCAMTFTSQHFLARALVYGISFTIGRYIHTISYLIGDTYGRILGFLITVIVLFVISIDYVYYITKRLYNLKYNP
ncbi:unnamed protein product [Adineta steineri]|uniref:Uncharacterized protein n=1 Tax=Adineta steineri TaxID=433720 RepID=A0A813N386_9BILA|nr:unnamed protein product [Adineta steineri]CAF4191377.1 unnamed protein product [Adineta steineri]CAF4226600.1 unnamed protein product [Adineta steineri]